MTSELSSHISLVTADYAELEARVIAHAVGANPSVAVHNPHPELFDGTQIVDVSVVVYSGGMDSFTLLQKTVRERRATTDYPRRIIAVSFNYNQRHSKELQCATAVCQRLDITHVIIPIPQLAQLAPKNALTASAQDVATPKGHYSADNMKITVVPGRNTVMLSLAMAYMEAFLNGAHGPVHPKSIGQILYGAHGGDHVIYPDCRPAFLRNMDALMRSATDDRVYLSAPFMYKDKTKILKLGLENYGLKAMDYMNTWTCYEGGQDPCEECGSCVERAEAFAANNVEDPLITLKRMRGTVKLTGV